MKTIVQLAVVLVCLGFVSQGNAQSPHPMTWTPQNATPGTRVTIAGTPFVLVRVPVKNLGVPEHATPSVFWHLASEGS